MRYSRVLEISHGVYHESFDRELRAGRLVEGVEMISEG
jgi:hypothetical protein